MFAPPGDSVRAAIAFTIDGSWSIIATQAKFMLAIMLLVRRLLPDCDGRERATLVVVSQLVLLRSGTVYSSVHSQCNPITGLLCACLNGLFAIYTLWIYRDDPAGAPPFLEEAPTRALDMRCTSC